MQVGSCKSFLCSRLLSQMPLFNTYFLKCEIKLRKIEINKKKFHKPALISFWHKYNLAMTCSLLKTPTLLNQEEKAKIKS